VKKKAEKKRKGENPRGSILKREEGKGETPVPSLPPTKRGEGVTVDSKGGRKEKKFIRPFPLLSRGGNGIVFSARKE